jgi:ferredoxin
VTGADWEILVDRDVCMGSGMCCMYAPNTFDIDDETKSTVKDAHGDPIDTIRTAIEACPTGALRLSARHETT